MIVDPKYFFFKKKNNFQSFKIYFFQKQVAVGVLSKNLQEIQVTPVENLSSLVVKKILFV